MINIFNDFNLNTIHKNVYRQGNAPKELPTEFYTVHNYNTNDDVSGDNKVKTTRWDWTIIYYTKDIADLYNGVDQAKTLLKSRGYEIDGQGYDYQGTYDEWYARAFDVTKLENMEEN